MESLDSSCRAACRSWGRGSSSGGGWSPSKAFLRRGVGFGFGRVEVVQRVWQVGWSGALFTEFAAEMAELVLGGEGLDDLARRTLGIQTKQRYGCHLQQAVPEHADRILKDPAWDALATVLADAKTAGHNSATLFDQGLSQRALDDARNPARTPTWRINRLGRRRASSPLAQAAAMARSTARFHAAPVHPPAATPTAVQQPQVRRR